VLLDCCQELFHALLDSLGVVVRIVVQAAAVTPRTRQQRDGKRQDGEWQQSTKHRTTPGEKTRREPRPAAGRGSRVSIEEAYALTRTSGAGMVNTASQIRPSIELLTNRTEPSTRTAFTPLAWLLRAAAPASLSSQPKIGSTPVRLLLQWGV